jgi:hypothetical protein
MTRPFPGRAKSSAPNCEDWIDDAGFANLLANEQRQAQFIQAKKKDFRIILDGAFGIDQFLGEYVCGWE